MTSDAMAIAWQVHRCAPPALRKRGEWPEAARDEQPPQVSQRIATADLIQLLASLEGPEASLICVRAGLSLARAPFDSLWLLLRASADLSTMLGHATRFWPSWTKTSHLERQARANETSLELAPTWRDGTGLARLHQVLAAALAGVVAEGVGTLPARVELPGEGSEALAERLSEELSAPVSFVDDRARISYSLLRFDTPLRHGDAPVAAFLLRSIVQQVGALEQTISARLDALLRGHLAKGISMELAASSLGLSERTLRRRLEDESTSYRERLDAVRRAYALTHLASRPVGEVARELGFMDIRSFQRAFRRWTSMTPLEFRRSVTLE